jgi:hypothetical protein
MKLKYRIRKYSIKSKCIMLIVSFVYRLMNENVFRKRIAENLRASLFDYKTLVKDIPYFPTDLVIDNNLYGLTNVLKEYCGIQLDKSLDVYIEHGVYFGPFVRWDQYVWNVSYNITFGQQRCNHLLNKKINKKILAIGPYIHYAQNLFDNNEIKLFKKTYGKILLVFPTHCGPETGVEFDVKSFIHEIELIRIDRFDSVFISLYWLDIIDGKYISCYEEMGYKIVTSGHRFDINFLNRQKTLIELADFTMSNYAGTHVGYCIYLRKPHYIYKQEVEYIEANGKNSFELWTDDDTRLRLLEELEINNSFGVYKNFISEEDNKVVDMYWGTSFIKSPEELRKILYTE